MRCAATGKALFSTGTECVQELKILLRSLTKLPGVSVHIVVRIPCRLVERASEISESFFQSGRPCDVLESWLSDLNVGMHAEHAFFEWNPESRCWSAHESFLSVSRVGSSGGGVVYIMRCKTAVRTGRTLCCPHWMYVLLT